MLKRVNAQNLHNLRQTQFQSQLFADDGHQHVNADGNPDLRVDGIVSGAEKVFDAQVLLNPLKEQFYAPAALVELRDDQWWQVKVIGQKDQRFVRFGVAITHLAEAVGVTFKAPAQRQPDDLIAAHPGACVHRARFQPVDAQARLGPGDKEGSRQHKTIQPRSIT